MIHLAPVPLLVAVVLLLIRAEFREANKAVCLLKPTATLLVILVAALSWRAPLSDSRYSAWLLVGLACSLAGDVALIFTSRKAFLLGLVAFMAAHFVYAVLFGAYSGFHAADLVTAAVLLAAGVAVYRYLLPGLGGIKLPVALYVLMICLMINRAFATFFGEILSLTQAWLISAGATLFWVSDLILAIHRFRRPLRYHRIGLAFYYAGQLLIALSGSYFA